MIAKTELQEMPLSGFNGEQLLFKYGPRGVELPRVRPSLEDLESLNNLKEHRPRAETN